MAAPASAAPARLLLALLAVLWAGGPGVAAGRLVGGSAGAMVTVLAVDSAAVRKPGPPGRPTVSRSSASVVVRVAVPSTGGAVLSSLRYTLTGTPQGAYAGSPKITLTAVQGVASAGNKRQFTFVPGAPGEGRYKQGVSYAFTVKAKNSAGWGPASAASAAFVTPINRKPCALATPTASAFGTTVWVRFTPSNPASDCPAVTSYRVQGRRIAGPASADITQTGVGQSVSGGQRRLSFVQGTRWQAGKYTAGTTYRFRVFARNVVGESTASPLSVAFTTPGAPTSPLPPQRPRPPPPSPRPPSPRPPSPRPPPPRPPPPPLPPSPPPPSPPPPSPPPPSPPPPSPPPPSPPPPSPPPPSPPPPSPPPPSPPPPSPPPPSPPSACITTSWSLTGALATARTDFGAVPLDDGTVLAVGGTQSSVALSSAARYNPATGIWAAVASMSKPRARLPLVKLSSGAVLAVGGDSDSQLTSQLYDPTTGTWAAPTAMAPGGPYHHTATLLPSGFVLVAGGLTPASTVSDRAQLYDNNTGAWTPTQSMATPRWHATATLVQGNVLVAGGHSSASSGSLATAQLFNPSTGTWTFTGSMATPRGGHSATLLPSGKVLVAGGQQFGGGEPFKTTSCTLWDPATGLWTPAAGLGLARTGHSAVLLTSGKVLVAGGETVGAALTATTEVYDPVLNQWTSTPAMAAPRTNFQAVLLPGTGRVLAAGGSGSIAELSSAELLSCSSPGAWP